MTTLDQSRATIIVPVFQRPSILKLFLESLIKTLPEKNQLIIIDDGSELETKRVISKYKTLLEQLFDFDLISHQTPQGDGICCNKALARARYPISIRLESDAILFEYWFEELCTPLLEDEDISAVTGVLIYPQTGGVNHAGLTFYNYIGRHAFLNSPPSCLPKDIFKTQCLAFGFTSFRTEAVQKIGGFDEIYHQGYDDLDLAMKLRSKGGITVVNPRAQAYHWEISSGLHRIAGRKRNLSIFWSRWREYIKDDLWDYLESSLGQLILEESDLGNSIVGVDMHSDRIGAQLFWERFRENFKDGLIDVLDLAHLTPGDNRIELPLVLGSDGYQSPQRYLYLVDNFVRVRNNYYYFTRRSDIRNDDIVVDFYGNSILINNLLNSSWPGDKIR